MGSYDGLKSLFGGGKDPGKKQLADVLAFLDQARADIDAGMPLGRLELLRGRTLQNQGALSAMRQNATGSAAAQQAILGPAQQRLAGLPSMMAERGQYTPRAAASATRGIIGDTTRRLGEINALAAGVHGGIAQQQGLTDAAALGDIASSYERQALARSGIYGAKARAIAGVQYDPKKDIFDVLGGIAGGVGAYNNYKGSGKG